MKQAQLIDNKVCLFTWIFNKLHIVEGEVTFSATNFTFATPTNIHFCHFYNFTLFES